MYIRIRRYAAIISEPNEPGAVETVIKPQEADRGGKKETEAVNGDPDDAETETKIEEEGVEGTET